MRYHNHNTIIPGSYVGVTERRDTAGKHPKKACVRCGRVRAVRPGRGSGDLCADCRWVDPAFGERAS